MFKLLKTKYFKVDRISSLCPHLYLKIEGPKKAFTGCFENRQMKKIIRIWLLPF
jgi:hypothetical protein